VFISFFAILVKGWQELIHKLPWPLVETSLTVFKKIALSC